MKNRFIKRTVLLIAVLTSVVLTYSQQLNTMYFMDNVPDRNYLNPAFQPLCGFYFGLPVIGNTQFGIGNNSITMKDVIYNQNGSTIYFFNPNGSKLNFYNALNPTTLLETDLQINLLNFGFKTKSGNSFWNFSLTEKMDGQLGIPKDILKFGLFGTPDLNTNKFDFSTLGVDVSLFTEAALGYSRKIDDVWSVGGKIKLLYGTANVSTTNQNITLNAGVSEWALKGLATINTATPGTLTIGNNFQNIGYSLPSNVSDIIKPIGLGAGVDLGLTVKPFKNFTLSAGVTDLGLINWNQNVKNITAKVDYTFSGLGSFHPNSNLNFQHLTDSILNDIKNGASATSTTNSYTTYTSPKLNIGLEYGFFDNKLSLGVLSRTIKHNNYYSEELTASVNGRPTDWFNLSCSYSVLNGRMSNIGAGMGIRTGFIHWFLAADYIPLYYTPLVVSNGSGSNPPVTAPIPYNTKGINFAIGINFVFGNRKDADRDGVVDSKDQCPDTPFGVIVDKKGCPVDTDGDGVPDYLDKCPNTPTIAYSTVDENGCPRDGDSDGVPDYMDKCPDTPKEAIGHVDKNGCTLDSDDDGVPDYLDKCPNTPKGTKVDKNGCPLDSDGDGIPDYLDKCPDTPKEAFGKVDKNGCPIDTDGDGIPDYKDKCPTEKGVASNNGCPEVKKEVKQIIKTVPKTEVKVEKKPELKIVQNQQLKTLFQKALQGIQFESGSDVILQHSNIILNQIAGVLIANPGYLIEVRGFTDNVGKPEANLILSQKRANSVRKYLISKGIDEKRITTNGFGDTMPVAGNDNALGRAMNRRVEFIVSYEEISFK